MHAGREAVDIARAKGWSEQKQRQERTRAVAAHLEVWVGLYPTEEEWDRLLVNKTTPQEVRTAHGLPTLSVSRDYVRKLLKRRLRDDALEGNREDWEDHFRRRILGTALAVRGVPRPLPNTETDMDFDGNAKEAAEIILADLRKTQADLEAGRLAAGDDLAAAGGFAREARRVMTGLLVALSDLRPPDELPELARKTIDAVVSKVRDGLR
jgi:hypothetical protein